MELKDKLQETMWKDFDTTISFPHTRPLLAHYTSIAVFEQMMANDEMWFSNPLFMNDKEELRFGMVTGANEFRSNTALKQALPNLAVHEKLIGYFNALFEKFDQEHVFHTYILCLSKHNPDDFDGRLSMWRGYGASGNGVAVVFDTQKIEVNESSPLIVGPVNYGTGDERRSWIVAKIQELAEILKGRELTDEQLWYAAYFWIERLKSFSLFTKHSGFSEEDEWRIVYMVERDPNALFKEMYGYAITQRGAEPKLKLKISSMDGMFSQNLSFEKIVDRIILGPTASSALAEDAVKRILVSKGKTLLTEKLTPSSIPFRSN